MEEYLDAGGCISFAMYLFVSLCLEFASFGVGCQCDSDLRLNVLCIRYEMRGSSLCVYSFYYS